MAIHKPLQSVYYRAKESEDEEELGAKILEIEEEEGVRVYDASSNKTFSFKTNSTTRRQQCWDIPGFERPKHDQSAKQDKAPTVLGKVKELIQEKAEEFNKDVKAPENLNVFRQLMLDEPSCESLVESFNEGEKLVKKSEIADLADATNAIILTTMAAKAE